MRIFILGGEKMRPYDNCDPNPPEWQHFWSFFSETWKGVQSSSFELPSTQIGQKIDSSTFGQKNLVLDFW